MFLFILESIGTSELILIGIIALIFLGPRKLPQIARTIGKTMADFRSTTNEFKSTWEREVNFEEEARALRDINFDEEAEAIRSGDLPSKTSDTIPRSTPRDADAVPLSPPEIRPADSDIFAKHALEQQTSEHTPSTSRETEPVDVSDKKNWL